MANSNLAASRRHGNLIGKKLDMKPWKFCPCHLSCLLTVLLRAKRENLVFSQRQWKLQR